ncbi:MAG: hypothetical protein V1776_01640 [Candidatus Diapherotrites archaeon]
MGKGFVIAVDALLALVILFTLLTISLESSRQNGIDWAQREQLQVLAYHAGESLELSNTLSHAVLSDSTTNVRSFLDGLPYHLCGSVTVYDNPSFSTSVFSVSKSGCATTLGAAETVQRGFIVASPPDANLYVASISMWVNENG